MHQPRNQPSNLEAIGPSARQKLFRIQLSFVASRFNATPVVWFPYAFRNAQGFDCLYSSSNGSIMKKPSREMNLAWSRKSFFNLVQRSIVGKI